MRAQAAMRPPSGALMNASLPISAFWKIFGNVNSLLTINDRCCPQAADLPQGNQGLFGGYRNMDIRIISEADIVTPADSMNAFGRDMLVAKCLAAAAAGDVSAYFDLGVAFSTGSHCDTCDLIEAHKWFNLAAAQGHDEAAWCRADISEEMPAREIAEAQRRARQWLASTARKAA